MVVFVVSACTRVRVRVSCTNQVRVCFKHVNDSALISRMYACVGACVSGKRTVVCSVVALGSDAAADTPTLLDAAGAGDCKQPTRA